MQRNSLLDINVDSRCVIHTNFEIHARKILSFSILQARFPFIFFHFIYSFIYPCTFYLLIYPFHSSARFPFIFSLYLFIHLSMYLLFTYLSIYPSIYLFISLICVHILNPGCVAENTYFHIVVNLRVNSYICLSSFVQTIIWQQRFELYCNDRCIYNQIDV